MSKNFRPHTEMVEGLHHMTEEGQCIMFTRPLPVCDKCGNYECYSFRINDNTYVCCNCGFNHYNISYERKNDKSWMNAFNELVKIVGKDNYKVYD